MKRYGFMLLFLLLIALYFHSSCKTMAPHHSLGDIVVYGDSRSDHATHRGVVNGILAVDPQVVFHTGDLVNDGLVQSEWDTFNAITAPLMAIADFYAAIGNHERNSDLYYDNFEFPGNERWYSIDVMNTHFIILDSCEGIAIGSEQYNWLEADLANTVNRPHHSMIAVVFHHPPYSTGKHVEDQMGLRSTIVPLFETYGVDVVFNGHDHCYERSFVNGIYYIVTGGGGAYLYDQTRSRDWSQVYIKDYHFCALRMHHKKIVVDVYDPSLNLLDHFVVYDVYDSEPRPAIAVENEPGSLH